MKVWIKVKLTDRNKDVEIISKSLTNYLYGYGPIQNITRKYQIKEEDRKLLDQYTANRIAGILMLYLAFFLFFLFKFLYQWQCNK